MKRVGLAALLVLAAAAPPLAQQQPRFQSGSLFLALSWLLKAKRAGMAVRERSEDVRLAHRYAEQYAALNGTRQPLVNVWVDYLER